MVGAEFSINLRIVLLLRNAEYPHLCSDLQRLVFYLRAPLTDPAQFCIDTVLLIGAHRTLYSRSVMEFEPSETIK